MNTYILTVDGAVACEARRDMIRRNINANYVFTDEDHYYENSAWYRLGDDDRWAIRIESLPWLNKCTIKWLEKCYPGSFLSLNRVKTIKVRGSSRAS